MRRPRSKSVRRQVWERAGGKCERCGAAGRVVHHLIPLEHGGPDNCGNTRLLCVACHDEAHGRPVGAEHRAYQLGLEGALELSRMRYWRTDRDHQTTVGSEAV